MVGKLPNPLTTLVGVGAEAVGQAQETETEKMATRKTLVDANPQAGNPRSRQAAAILEAAAAEDQMTTTLTAVTTKLDGYAELPTVPDGQLAG